MDKYNVTGMSCAACAARVEKAVSEVQGVKSCTVSLLTNSMGVEGSASAEAVIEAVKAAGYGAALGENTLEDTETPEMKKRLFTSVAFLLVLMYFSMGHTMWNFPIPRFMEENCLYQAFLQLILTIIVMIINRRFFISGYKGIINKAPNMDTLVALGSLAGFIYSLYALIALIITRDESYMHEFYFESAAMILTLITVGKTLEAHSKGKTTDALRALMKITPKTALVLRGGVETEIPADQVKEGDIFAVYAGSNIPVDGIVIEGSASVDESALTGESIPADKFPGSPVSAATTNQTGYLKCKATAVGENTTISQIIRLVSDAASTKAPIARTADKISAVFVPTVMTIAVITAVIWLLLGRSAGFALARGISVLVISCPCALGLATPVAIMVANGVGAQHGILFKTAAAIEETGRVQTVVLDKTGTITQGRPVVTDVIPSAETTENELLAYAYSIEKLSRHPLAGAIVEYCEGAGNSPVQPMVLNNFETIPGKGLSAELNNETLRAGNPAYISHTSEIPHDFSERINQLTARGKTVMAFSVGSSFLGAVAVADVMKKDSPNAVSYLKNMGIRVIMLTGDNKNTAKSIGEQAGVDDVIAEVLPGEKEAVIRSLQAHGKVAMVGDGINDAPALTRADVGIAIGAGADVAIDSANVVLVKGSLIDAVNAISLSRKALKNIKENLFWSFFYNSIGIPIAAGALTGIGITLNPMIAAACMSLSSFCVVSNALRLNLIKLKDGEAESIKAHKSENNILIQEKENNQVMEKIFNVEGMMCPHCEARVVKAVEAIDGVEKVIASHETNTATVYCTEAVSDASIIEAIEKQDYKVIL